ncbi:MAG TPA: fructose-bisphosphate aldolase class I [Dehalococcoidia bacterium]|nr:fructose-bisphosphate aldolase class I [Dehalococcoidia bacterium]
MDINKLSAIAKRLVSKNKGVLAADESSPTIKKRFDSIGIESTENNRRDYRELLFSTSGIEDYISGIILYEETLFQKSLNGNLLIDLLKEKKIIPGIKVDKSTKNMTGFKNEKITEGLDGLYERIANYQSQGAEFTKWRAVITIGNSIPTNECIELNAIYLARYALISQEVGLVPIVEPEILMDGDHSINSCYEATNKTLSEVFNQLNKHKVNLSGILLKPNMVLSGKESSDRANKNQVAEMTLKCFKDTIPENVPGIIFLSGGQSDLESIDNLDAINKLAKQTGNRPWELSFSYGRGLQSSTLNKWNGNSDNVQIAQKEFIDRCKMVSDARNGQLS